LLSVADFLPETVWETPEGCEQLPLGTHVILNETEAPIEVYADPTCLTGHGKVHALAAILHSAVLSLGSNGL
jgi:hypothetical protein